MHSQPARSAESSPLCVASGVLYICLADIKCWRDVMRSALILISQSLDYMEHKITTMAWMARAKLSKRRLSAGFCPSSSGFRVICSSGSIRWDELESLMCISVH